MCFSATASFISGSVLLITGAACVRCIRKPEQFAFALIPFLFGFQQCIEGCLWLSLTGDRFIQWKDPLMYAFLFFAQVLWPVWVPLSFYRLELNKRRRLALLVVLCAGVGEALYLAYCLFSFPVSATVFTNHIRYDLDFPRQPDPVIEILYFVVTIFPPFISGVKYSSLIGVSLLLSFVVSKLFFGAHVISVWCFFAAIVSLNVYIVLKKAALPLALPGISRK